MGVCLRVFMAGRDGGVFVFVCYSYRGVERGKDLPARAGCDMMGPMKKTRVTTTLLMLLRVGLGAFFLYTGLMKVADLATTAQFMTASRLLPAFFSMPIACLGVAMELVVGGCLVLRYQYRGAALWGVVMTTVFVLLYVQAWVRGLDLTCNCMGSEHALDNYALDIAIRMLLLGGMLLLYWEARSNEQQPFVSRKLDFSDL